MKAMICGVIFLVSFVCLGVVYHNVADEMKIIPPKASAFNPFAMEDYRQLEKLNQSIAVKKETANAAIKSLTGMWARHSYRQFDTWAESDQKEYKTLRGSAEAIIREYNMAVKDYNERARSYGNNYFLTSDLKSVLKHGSLPMSLELIEWRKFSSF